MKKSSMVWLGGLMAVLAVAGWMYYYQSSSYAPAYPGTSQKTPSAVPESMKSLTLNTMSSSDLGTYLVAGNGMTLYRYTKDAPGVSNCSGACAVKWPPYTVTADASLQGGVSVTGNIAAITRADGTLQATYNGEPLYFWYGDVNPGETTGQNVGGVWFVVAPK